VCLPAIASLLAQARRANHLATAGCWFRGVPEWYVAVADTRGRQEGRPYPWSQQVIHEISRLDARRRGVTTEPYGAIRRKHAPAQAGGGAIEGNGADDALMVIRDFAKSLTFANACDTFTPSTRRD